MSHLNERQILALREMAHRHTLLNDGLREAVPTCKALERRGLCECRGRSGYWITETGRREIE